MNYRLPRATSIVQLIYRDFRWIHTGHSFAIEKLFRDGFPNTVAYEEPGATAVRSVYGQSVKCENLRKNLYLPSY